MTLKQLKKVIPEMEKVRFKIENGDFIPEYAHLTEIGLINKHFIDCGGKVRRENKISFQIWDGEDFEHKLKPEKLMKIIEMAENVLVLDDLEIEVEYQGNTIGKYGLEYDGENFVLTGKKTDCLAKSGCCEVKMVKEEKSNNKKGCC